MGCKWREARVRENVSRRRFVRRSVTTSYVTCGFFHSGWNFCPRPLACAAVFLVWSARVLRHQTVRPHCVCANKVRLLSNRYRGNCHRLKIKKKQLQEKTFQCGLKGGCKHTFIIAPKKIFARLRLLNAISQWQPVTTPNEAAALNAQCVCGSTADELESK